jgi:photosystem II stability/assembly factor-like uncharacterized protein
MIKETMDLKHKKLLLKLCPLIIIPLVFLLNFCIFDVNNAWAHRPHHVVIQLRVSPNYSQDQTLFIIVRHNLFKSTDGGNSWQRIVNGLDNRGRLAYLSGNANHNHTMYLSSFIDGIYKTEDGGGSWFKVNQGLNTLNIDLLSVAAESENIVLAVGDNNQVYKTEDGGENWQQIMKTEDKITAITFAGSANKIIIGDEQGYLYTSEDGGKNWHQLEAVKNSGAVTVIATSADFSADSTFWIGTEKKGIFQTDNNGKSFTDLNSGLTDKYITDLVIASPENLYASTWNQGFFASHDGGKSWTKQDGGLTKDRQADELKLPHFNVLGVSDSTIFLGSFDGLFKSLDAGNSWQALETLSLGTVMALDVSPNYINDGTLAIVTYVGNFYLSTDRGSTWEPMNKGLEIPRLINSLELDGQQHPRRFFDVAFSPNYAQDKTIFASLLWSKLLKSANGGNDWQVIQLPREVRGVTIVPSPNYASDGTLYVANQSGLIFKSTDGGQNLATVGKIDQVSGNDSPSLVISPNFFADLTLYASSQKGIYKTIDGGKTWASVTDRSKLKERYNLQLAISPNYQEDQTLIVGTDKGIFQTEDGGRNWTELVRAELGETPYIEGVAISPNYQSDHTLIVSVRGKGLYKTVDAGQSFTSIGDKSLPLSKMNEVPSAGMPIKFSPSYATDNTIYGFGSATTEVFKSTDGGNSWQTLSVPINPVSENEQYDLMTSLSLWVHFYRSKILRTLAAVVAGLLTYVLMGYLRLEEKIPLSRLQVKVISSAMVFVVALIFLYQY